MKRVPKVQFELIQRNAMKGFAIAQLCLGECYFTGNGVAQNYEEALEWFRRAAEQGNPRAQNKIATFYLKGYGLEKDETLAYAWILIAMESGHSPWHLRFLAFWVKQLLNKDQLQSAQAFASDWHDKRKRERDVPAAT